MRVVSRLLALGREFMVPQFPEVCSPVLIRVGCLRAIARLALVLAKAPYQLDETLVEDVLSEDRCEERFIRLLAWASFSGARRFAQRIAQAAESSLSELNCGS